ncbi:MAG: GNAT family N-acetyltransferase [Acidiferrobacterales bacterium]
MARSKDAQRIGLMSRTFIEGGLPWSWHPVRVARQIRCRDTIVLTAWVKQRLIAFAIMHFREESAHLNLLAVEPGYRSLGIGRHLMEWLEKTARVAGTFIVSLEVRASNRAARAFYRKLGYTEIVSIPKYYSGREAAIRMSRDLHCRHPLDAI